MTWTLPLATQNSPLRFAGLPFRLGLPRWILYLLFTFLVVKFLIAWYLPANDIDSISSYLVRNYFAKFGPLEKTATFEFLYTFPTTFDFIFGPLLSLQKFETLPNFALFMVMLFIFFRQAPKDQHVSIFALVFCCQALLTQMSSGKNDMALGVFALLAWSAIYHLKNSRLQSPAVLLALAALAGTKWMGVPLAAMLLCALLFESYKDRKLIETSLAALLLSPILFQIASVETYITNFVTYGSVFYVSPESRGQMDEMAHMTVAHNAFHLLRTLALKTFDFPAYLLDLFLLNGALAKPLWYIFPHCRYYATPAADFSGIGGVVAILCATLAVTCLFRKGVERELKISSAVALIYVGVVVVSVGMNPFSVRYLLPAYILMILPSARLLNDIAWLKYVRPIVLGMALLTMIPTLFMQREHLLIPVTEVGWSPRSSTDASNPASFARLESMFEKILRRDKPKFPPPHVPDREALQFMVWAGLLRSYDYYRAMVPHADSLMMVNFDIDRHSPVGIGPFLRLRDPANTEMHNVRTGMRFGDWRERLGYVRYVMAWDGEFSDERYCLVHSHRPYLTIHRLKERGECPALDFVN